MKGIDIGPDFIFQLLKHLRNIKEFELFYYLFNQVNVKVTKPHNIEISGEDANKALNKTLAEVLFSWTGEKWNVIIAGDNSFPSLKEKAKGEFLESQEWKMIKSAFEDAKITDISLR
ncbi:MAG: hypothetical protein KA998_01825 [Rickettsiaceae bacterium]|nr:hypothetical protein [Rickettsiaceae bacterium]